MRSHSSGHPADTVTVRLRQGCIHTCARARPQSRQGAAAIGLAAPPTEHQLQQPRASHRVSRKVGRIRRVPPHHVHPRATPSNPGADQTDAQSWYLLGRCYMSQQKYPKAYEAYQQAVYRDGRNPTFWCSIGVLYYQINQYRDALDAYSRAIRLNPNISEVWYDLGTLVSLLVPGGHPMGNGAC